jgi:hypothetical protein
MNQLHRLAIWIIGDVRVMQRLADLGADVQRQVHRQMLALGLEVALHAC